MDGPFNPKQGDWFDTTKILDPYAKIVGGRDQAKTPDWNDIYHHRARCFR